MHSLAGGALKVIDEMKRVKARVDDLILNKLLPSYSPVREIDLLYKMMRDYPGRPAKGLRPFLCVTACKAFGGKEDDALLTAACIELFQNWILIHDDIEDASELRRGEPVLHKKYDVALAINAGDALHARMWGLLLLNEKLLGSEKTLHILQEFSKMVNETTEGQHMELVWILEKRWDLDDNDYIEMCSRKTAWYTAVSPCRLGAIIAGAGSDVLEKLLSFGLKLGVGFQIQDDVLNLIGEQSSYGKAKFEDILEGKRTLILLRLIKVAKKEERERVIEIMNKKREEKRETDIDYVISLIRKYGTIDYARVKARQLVNEAIKILDEIDCRDSGALSLLKGVANFMVERQW